MAETTISADAQMEQELTQLFGGDKKETTSSPATGEEAGIGAKTDPATDAAVTPPTAASTEQTEELSDAEKALKALEELKEEEPPKDDKTPALSPDQEIILRHIPDAQTAEQLVTIANNHAAFENTLQTGDFATIEAMFQGWNPQAYDRLLEGFYQKYVASGELVQRFIAENDPEQKGNKFERQKQTKLEREVQELKATITQRQQAEQQQNQQSQNQKTFQAYTAEIDRLFAHVGITDPADQKYIRAAINADVRADAKLVKEIAAGKLTGLTSVFKTNANTYLKRDKQFAQKTEAKIKEQAQKKIPVGGGGGTVTSDTNTGPAHDFRNVEKGKEDATLTERLTGFFATKKRK